MENQTVIVVPRAEAMELEIAATTQSLRETQFAVAKALGIPSNRITCHIKRLGTTLRFKLLCLKKMMVLFFSYSYLFLNCNML